MRTSVPSRPASRKRIGRRPARRRELGWSRSLTSWATLVALLSLSMPSSVWSGPAGSRLDGVVMGVDGRPASGYRVHLIDGVGNDVAQSTADDRGVYSFSGVQEGAYSLGIETLEGRMAPVAGPPVQLGDSQLARRDVKLMQTDPIGQQATTRANYGIGMWWGGLSSSAKAWTIVGLIAIVGITVVALTDDDDSDPPASPF